MRKISSLHIVSIQVRVNPQGRTLIIKGYNEPIRSMSKPDGVLEWKPSSETLNKVEKIIFEFMPDYSIPMFINAETWVTWYFDATLKASRLLGNEDVIKTNRTVNARLFGRLRELHDQDQNPTIQTKRATR